MAKDSGKDQEQAREGTLDGASGETNQQSQTIQEQAESVLSGEATLVDHGQQSAEADERRRAEEDRMAEEADKASGPKAKASGKA